MTTPLTPKEIMHARRLARLGHTGDDLPQEPEMAPEEPTCDLDAAKGIIIGVMIGTALWAVIGLILYFTFFRGM